MPLETAVLMLGLALGAESAPASTPADAAFWRWFQANAARLSAEVAKGPSERLLDEVQREIRKAVPGVAFELGFEGPRKPRVLVVSADGLREHFPEVQRLVAAAPARIPGWRVVAFRQRFPGFEVQIQGVHLRPGDVWFRSERDGGAVNVVLFVRPEAARTPDALRMAVLQLLDATVGEYDMETRVAGIDLRPLTGDPKQQGLRPLPELAAVVDAVKALGPER